MSWAEAQYTINEINSAIENKETGNKSVLVIKTRKAAYAEQIVHVDAANGYVQYIGILTTQTSGIAQAVVVVDYATDYNIYVGSDNPLKVTVSSIGSIQDVNLDEDNYVLYGFHISSTISDPDAKVEPVPGTDNYGYKNVSMNLATGIINGGDWFKVRSGVIEDAPFFFPRSCMLKYNGTVDYYLNENDESKKEDGTASAYNSTSYGGNAMMEWGQNGKIIYMKVVPDADAKGGYYFFSDKQLDSGFKDYAFRDKNNNQVPHFYTSKYFGSYDGTRMRSLAGQSNMVSTTAQQEIDRARANGSDIWDTTTLAQWMLINGLLILMAGTTNTQTAYGRGRADSSSALSPGNMYNKGMFFGSSDGTVGVKVFGMENWWGNIWRRIRGYINASGTIKVKLTRGTYDGSSTSDYNTDGSNYITISDCTPSGTNGGYISECKFTQYGMFGKVMSGSETTHYCDGLWYNNGQTNYASVGGAWDNGSHVGPLYVALNGAPSGAYTGFGSALSCTPLYGD